MTESKKRWFALIMAMIMLIALLPDSFLSTEGVRADNINESDKNTQTIDNIEKETADSTSEKKTIIRKFQGETELKNEIFSFILYDENNEIILQLDNLGKEDKTEVSDELGIKVSAQTDDTNLIITLEDLNVNNKYSYKLENNGDTEYAPVTEIIDMEKPLLEVELAIIIEAGSITLYISQVQTAESMDIIYKVYEAADNQIKGDVLVEGKIERLSSTVKKVVISDYELLSRQNYGIKFYNGTKLLSIQYVDNSRVLGEKNNPIDITKDIEPLKLQISYENLGNTYTDVNNPNNKYYQGRKATLEVNKDSDRIDIETLRKKIIESISVTTTNDSQNHTNNPLTLTLSEKAEDGTYHVTDKNGNIILKISEWNEINNSYNIEFVQSGEYLWNNIEYSDESGNIASVSFSKVEGSMEDDKSFVIDNTGPKADCFINIFPDINSQSTRKDGNLLEEQKSYILRNTSLQLVTNLSSTDKSEFCLENVFDDYSGISKVDYHVFEETKDYQALTEWTNWTNGISDINNNAKLCVSKDTDGIYYMYYRLEDKIGNISYYDGLGFKLDVTPPEIELSYSIDNKEYKTISGSAIVLNKDVQIKAVITETNLSDDNIVLKINTEKKDCSILQKNNNSKELTYNLTAQDGEDIVYKIDLTCTDDVGHSSTATATVRIDKKPPVIQGYTFTPSYKWENDDKVSFFNEDVQAVLAIEDVNFNENNSKVSIKKNEEEEVLLTTSDNGYGKNIWEKDNNNSNIYKTILNFKAGNSTDDKYIIKVTYTDDAGNTVENEKIIVIDTNPPVVSIKFTDTEKPVSGNKKKYYKKRTAEISITEVSSLDIEEFEKAIKEGISVKDKNNNEIYITGNKNPFYEIKKRTDLNNSYNVEFTGDGHYELNISYTDKCGNATKQPAKDEFVFSIDNTLPTAKGQVELYKYMDSENPLSEKYDLSQTDKRKSYLSTYFEIMGNKYPSKFILTDIQDNLSGVNEIKYYLVNQPLDENVKLEDITGWKNKNDVIGNQEFIVTLPEKEEPTAYYIYYCIEDYAGNKAYYNGAGILLDQKNPDIKEFTYQNGGECSVDEPEEIEGEKINVYTFSDNVQINFEIQETNFVADDTKIRIEKYNFEKKNYTDISIGSCTWNASEDKHKTSISTNIEALRTEKNQVNQYKITVTTKDKVGRTDKRTEIIRIDKQQANIMVKYQDALTEQMAPHYYNKEREAEIRIEKKIYSFVNPEEFREAIIKGIYAKNEKYEDIIDTKEILNNIPAITEGFEVKAGDKIYEMSAWNPVDKSYTIKFYANAIYEINIEYTDRAGNESNVKYEPEDGASFVIDNQVPQVTVTYDNMNKLKEYFYYGKRTSQISVTDLSFVYASKVEKKEEKIKNILKEKVEKKITAIDTKGNRIEAEAEAVKIEEWLFDNGVYKQKIEFNGEAIYSFDISPIQDLCGMTCEKDNIQYNVSDGKSFVIDKTGPQITVIYHDSDTNKHADEYYKDSRTADIIVEDLSYIYEDKLSESKDLTPENRISDWIEITAKDAKGNLVTDAFKNEKWIFLNSDSSDSLSGVYKKSICFEKDAIYTFSILNNGEVPADIYEKKATIVYKNIFDNKETDVKDYDSFVISRNAPDVCITYNDTPDNKLKNHYYTETRTATIVVSDLSFVYEDSQKKDLDSLAVNKIQIEITAENEKAEQLTDSYSVTGWNFDKENAIYTQEITYTGDAIYSWSISGKNIYEWDIQTSYQDKQNQKVEDYDSFVIDRQAPKIIVTYNDTNKVSDYFYQGGRTAKIEVSDLSYVYEDYQRISKEGDMSVITDERVELNITAKDESDKSVAKAYKESGWNFDTKNGVYINNIYFEKDAIYKYENSAMDIYGRQAEFTYTNEKEHIKDWNSFVIDTQSPEVIVTYDDRNKGTNLKYVDGYYKDNRTAKITVSDLSFVYADKYMPERAGTENLVLNNQTGDNTNSYILPEITAYSNDIERDVKNAHTMNLESLWSWNKAQNGYQADIIFMAEANYSFHITGKDICKNPANVSYSNVVDANSFVIDKTAPTISITYDDNSPVRMIDGRGYFARTRTATIIITEGCDTFDTEDASNNIIITAKDAAGNDIGPDTYAVSGWTESKASQNGTATKYTAEIIYQGDANYTFEISYTDKTGHTAADINTNSNITPYVFTVDSGAPTGTISVSGFGSWNRLTELLTFDRWSNSSVNITASANDGISSVYSIKYYKTAAVTAMTRQQLLDLSDSLWTDYNPFSVRPDEMFSVYLRIEDRSGNISFINSDGVIVDATAPNEESIAPEITIVPVQPVNNIYNTDVTIDITVTDPIVNNSYSGLKSIRYEVQNMGTVTQQGQLYTFNYVTGQTLQSQLLQRWNGQITVDRNLNNSNDVRIVVYAQDNSDNMSNAYTAIQIDVTQPSIDISYDNNNGDASFGTSTYFNADRTATIRITERNFNADDVQITITNTDGTVPAVSNWSSSAGTGNGDDTVHTATVTYSADGDYVFAISYADLAGNTNTDINYRNSAAPEQFTIDKTVPVINVTYDNNSMQNDNYYNAVRTATISITEHNFDAGRYNIILTASDDGADKAAPSIGTWSNNGDIHTALVQFTDDGYYSMDMSYTDMAGNQAAQFTQQTFYVDQTMPRVEVRGIRNNTANNNETIGFEITCTDTNFDVFTPQLSVTKMVDGKNVTENCEINQMTPIRNGQTYIVDNLEQDGIYSLTCTARDKAGNVFDRVVYLNDAGQEEDGMEASEGISFLNFSVNRRGSVYTLDSYTDEVAKYYYVREVDENLVIVETNVDTLSGYIELNGKKLTEGTDYRVEISGGNGEWYVVRYIINKELFAGEGEYKIVAYSEDNAGNTAYSDIKGTNMSFIIDRTAPIVTVAGIEDNGRYQVERQTVTVIPKDDGGKLQKITIEAFDQNGDMLNGFPIVYEGEELIALLEENNGELTFELPEGTGMSVRITCEDAAGNEMDTMSFDNIVVSTNRLTIVLADKRFIYGVIAGIVVLTVLIVLLIVWKKHTKKQAKENNGAEQT